MCQGINEPRVSASGAELPTARYVSTYNHRDFGYHDHAVTVYLPAWGQLIDHDMVQGGESKGKLYVIYTVPEIQTKLIIK